MKEGGILRQKNIIATLNRTRKRKRFSCRRFHAAFIEPSVTFLVKTSELCTLIDLSHSYLLYDPLVIFLRLF